MKALFVAAGMAAGFLSLASYPAEAQRCVDPPNSTSGRCSKEAGASCDPATRRWINGSKSRYDACMAAAGAKPTYNDSYKNIKR